jgi:tRNA (guanine37-N1)-methyltransferase
MRFDILTLFPQALEPYLATSILGRAQQAGLIEPHLWDIRQFATDKHKVTDDTPYGGGAGMVMKIEPIDQALAAVIQQVPRDQQRVVVLSAKGKQFTQELAQQWVQDGRSITFICGRYEGIDQRVIDYLADEEISVGPYVLAGGELPALTILETMARLIPGVLGNENSLREESSADQGREYPQYTKPEVYREWAVPPVLLSGNHAEIKKWRDGQRKS